MTFREIGNAISGCEDAQAERNDIILYGNRKVIFHVVRALSGKKGFKKEQDIYPLSIDKIIKRARVRKMKPVVVTRTEVKKDG